MATFPQAQDTERPSAIYAQIAATTRVLQAPVIEVPLVGGFTNGGGVLTKITHRVESPILSLQGREREESSGGYQIWFEEFHVLPRAFDLGNVLSSQSIPLQVFYAGRRDTATWDSFVNNAGAGVTLSGQPSLPTTFDPMTEISMQLEIDTAGDPFVDTTLDFVFSTGTTLVPIALQRIVLWSLKPELPYAEVLGFLTDVITAKSGKEKRQALRKNPRSVFEYDYMIDDVDRPLFESRMFDFHARQFGVPVWYDDCQVDTAVLAGDLVITVNDTAFRDFRVGGLALILADDGTFDVLNLTAITATTLVSDAPTLNGFAVGVDVYPLSTSRVEEKLGGGRFPTALSTLRLNFAPSDNDSNLASIAHFPTTYKGKPVIESGQVLRGQLRESFETLLVEIDSVVGLREVTSPWDGQKHARQLTLRAHGRQAGWELRQFAHWARGRQVTFYVPRDFPDMIVTADLLSASQAMEIENIGYTQFVRQRPPHNSLYLVETDGTVHMRDITNSVVSGDPTKEGLTVDTVWPSTILAVDVERTSFMEKMRFDTDKLKLQFDVDAQTVRLTAPIKTVFE